MLGSCEHGTAQVPTGAAAPGQRAAQPKFLKVRAWLQALPPRPTPGAPAASGVSGTAARGPARASGSHRSLGAAVKQAQTPHKDQGDTPALPPRPAPVTSGVGPASGRPDPQGGLPTPRHSVRSGSSPAGTEGGLRVQHPDRDTPGSGLVPLPSCSWTTDPVGGP